MKTEDLIHQLSADLPPVQPLAAAPLRWRRLLLSQLAVLAVGLIFWFFAKREIHFPAGRPLLEAGLLLAAFLIASWQAVLSVSPHFASVRVRRAGFGFTAVWVAVLGAAFWWLHREVGDEALTALQYQTWFCPAVIFSMTVPAAIFAILQLRRGAILFPRTTAAYVALSSLTLGAFGLGFICPWTDPLHELLWHVVPVITVLLLVLSFRNYRATN